MLKDVTIEEFIKKVDSKNPAPGGGSVSANVGALGIALARMLGHVTINKKKFMNLSKDEQKAFKIVFNALEKSETRLIELIDEDTNAFNEIMSAFKLPKTTDAEKKERSTAIQKATIHAIETPMEIATICLDALEQFDILIKHGNKNAISDLGVAVLNISSAIEGSLLNVKINLTSLKDETLKKHYKNDYKRISIQNQTLKNKFLETINKQL
ncbi:MAG: cyclodeaminase/cyclohydrolase family protein [Candidatus Izimaplasma sp.]|nr:cyclodeaminase/cyclohydrolase family protein [Candidatus Izimaplasma bacterium]